MFWPSQSYLAEATVVPLDYETVHFFSKDGIGGVVDELRRSINNTKNWRYQWRELALVSFLSSIPMPMLLFVVRTSSLSFVCVLHWIQNPIKSMIQILFKHCFTAPHITGNPWIEATVFIVSESAATKSLDLYQNKRKKNTRETGWTGSKKIKKPSPFLCQISW